MRTGNFITKVSDTSKVSGVHLCLLAILMSGCDCGCDNKVSPYQDSNKSTRSSSGTGGGTMALLSAARSSTSEANPTSGYFTSHGGSSEAHGG
jgi:hypothetical protein